MRENKNIVGGCLFIVLAIVIGLRLFNIWTFKGWWTLFIIIPSIAAIIKNEDKKGGIVGLVIGFLLLLSVNGFVEFGLISKIIVVLIFLAIGFSLILGSKKSKIDKNSNMENSITIFSGHEMDYSSKEFKGYDGKVMFGGLTLDLRKATFNENQRIDVIVLFGGADIYVPPNINVKITPTGIFGDVENKATNGNDNQITLYINATAIFGGINII